MPKSFQRATGFAEQMDVHEPTATVREALQFSALLRQPREVPRKEKLDYCETIIDLLEMRDIAGATIGQVGEGLNPEQRKRLTIGVELASKPELLMFLDEPTSGLDSGAAFNIVRFLRKLADAGQAVLCTIHQPSAVLFEHFDELLLLKSGGRVVYHGPLGEDSRELIKYFESNGAPKCPRDRNPAEYMLEAIGAGDPNYHGQDWGDVWAGSSERDARSREIEDMVKQRKNVEPSQSLKDDREYASPLSLQTLTVVKRSFVSYWRKPNYIIGKFFLHILTGLFNCFTFWMLGYKSVDFQNRLFSIFMTLTISPPLIQQLQPVFIQSRNLFQSRENNAKIYSWFAWVTAAVIVEIPYAIVAGKYFTETSKRDFADISLGGIYFNCWWWGIFGTRVSSFTSGFAFLLVLLFELYYVSFGQAIAAFAPNELVASLMVPIFFLFVVSFCGVVVPPMQLPTFWRRYVCPSPSNPGVSQLTIEFIVGCIGFLHFTTSLRVSLGLLYTNSRSNAPRRSLPSFPRQTDRPANSTQRTSLLRLGVMFRQERMEFVSFVNMLLATSLAEDSVSTTTISGGTLASFAGLLCLTTSSSILRLG